MINSKTAKEFDLINDYLKGSETAFRELAESGINLVIEIAKQYKDKASLLELIPAGFWGWSEGLRIYTDKKLFKDGDRPTLSEFVEFHIKEEIESYLEGKGYFSD